MLFGRHYVPASDRIFLLHCPQNSSRITSTTFSLCSYRSHDAWRTTNLFLARLFPLCMGRLGSSLSWLGSLVEVSIAHDGPIMSHTRWESKDDLPYKIRPPLMHAIAYLCYSYDKALLDWNESALWSANGSHRKSAIRQVWLFDDETTFQV